MPDLKDFYLMAYNGACCGGWAMVLYLAVNNLISALSSDPELSIWDAQAQLYQSSEELQWWLTVSQSAAVMEILHGALGLVRSPVMVTFLQVSSRIVALIAITQSAAAQSQWGAALMILSWALVEVPRYAFYLAALITGDSTKGTPYPLFWLRYSLFAVLYPTGIIGELTVFLAAAKDEEFLAATHSLVGVFYGAILPVVYLFGSPFMIFNMVSNRANAFKKRFAKPPPPPRGLCWPKDPKTGERSTTKINQAIVAAALGAGDEEKSVAALKARGWRFNYWKHLKALVQEQCESPEACLNIAQAGLDKAYELFEFVHEDGSAVSFKEAMEEKSRQDPFYTMEIKGTGTSKVDQIEVPYKGETLSGQALKDQVQKWVDYGTIEPSAGDAIIKCVDNPKWVQNVAKGDRCFVLLGAGSAMGPLLVLLSLGAHVVAIDLDRPQIWKRLIELARNSKGTLTFPVKQKADTLKTDDEIFASAGANLFTDTPRLRDWLVDLHPKKDFCVGSYAYLNGALHVQVSLAMDALCRDLTAKRKKGTVSLAYLCTPTDLHLIPKDAYVASQQNYMDYQGRVFCRLLQLFSLFSFLKQNARKILSGGGLYYLVNGISVAQGPNYALAKRMQHWRAVVARSQGHAVSSNIAPSTSTVSVVQNRTFAWAYEGMPYFKPYEIFAPETSNSVMTALLLFDLNDTKGSVASEQTSSLVLTNPNQLFSYGSFHGGLWRCAYTVDSIGEASVLLYFSRLAQPYMLPATAAVGAVAAIVYFAVASGGAED